MERISIVDYYKEYVENIKKLRESEKYQKEFNSIKNICVELIEEIYVLCGKYKNAYFYEYEKSEKDVDFNIRQCCKREALKKRDTVLFVNKLEGDIKYSLYKELNGKENMGQMVDFKKYLEFKKEAIESGIYDIEKKIIIDLIIDAYYNDRLKNKPNTKMFFSWDSDRRLTWLVLGYEHGFDEEMFISTISLTIKKRKLAKDWSLSFCDDPSCYYESFDIERDEKYKLENYFKNNLC